MMKTDVRDTSIEAHHEPKASGDLGRQQQEVYDLFLRHPGLRFTRNEVAASLSMRLSSVCGRINALIARRLLEDGERRTCGVTGKNCHAVSIAGVSFAHGNKGS